MTEVNIVGKLINVVKSFLVKNEVTPCEKLLLIPDGNHIGNLNKRRSEILSNIDRGVMYNNLQELVELDDKISNILGGK